ncbi:Lrp/AsnC family transcriptional regulator [Microvirga terricola]|uniref:Lrp/AsnC family transcriptional regulator n=1 Tax=Microvirga terricola TaxID=2719797 RepID=A0ABX0V7X9_9HYPH|nr:Lrp/AsnC family transcriptional regulator [Microvirga terricola]NIX75311.1 Lrp/AsnC family transcriptional regulator [Microvirga terricola]
MKQQLDAKDTAILAVLHANARAPVVAIARQVGLSRSATQERIARLERDGVILSYTTETREPHSSVTEGYLLVSLGSGLCSRQVASIRRIDGVRSCRAVSGEIDVVVHVVASGPDAFSAVRDRVAALPEVGSVRTCLVLPG